MMCALLGGAACSDPDGTECAVGTTQTCSCDAGTGTATCDASEHFGTCACGGSPDLATRNKLVFLTSVARQGDLGGRTGDQFCSDLISSGTLGGSWRAWISTSTEQAIDHVLGAGPWYTTSGKLAFPDRAALATTPLVEIDHDEKGEPLLMNITVWTGTNTGGTRSAHNCLDWTTIMPTSQGSTGTVRRTPNPTASIWTQEGLNRSDCNGEAHLYCFEQ